MYSTLGKKFDKKVQEMNFKIRQENKNDYDEVYALIKTAFETAKVKDGSEQDYAVKLRNSKGYIPALALAAEKDGKLIGHIMLTKLYVKQENGESLEALLVAPLSVLIEHRDKGIGSALMKEGLKRAKELGYKFAILVGDPNYYNRFGFEQSSLYGITNEDGFPDQFVMVNKIVPNALDNVSGTISFH